MIRDFKNDVNFSLVVSIDMLATGFDMKSLECLLFMCKVDSPVYVEQMIRRGCCTIDTNLLHNITPSVVSKDSYFTGDTVGALDILDFKIFSVPLIYKRYKNLKMLINKVASNRTPGVDLEALVDRIGKLTKRISTQANDQIKDAVGGKTIEKLVQLIRETNNPEIHKKKTKHRFGESPTNNQICQVKKEMLIEEYQAFCNPNLRNAILNAVKRDDLIITQKHGELIGVISIEMKKYCESFDEFVNEHRDEFIALQILYDTPVSSSQACLPACQRIR